MAKHTPGPWIMTNDGRDVYDGETARDLSGAWTGNWPNLIAQCAVLNRKDNARLISAAPDLLEELKSMTARFGRCARAVGNSEETIAAACASANAVIAKAEGITHAGSACVVPSNPYENRGNYRADGELRIGDYVNARIADCAALESACGPAVVVALDDSGSMDNRPSVWIRYTSNDGYYRYRSVDQFDVDLVRLPSEPPP